MSKRSGSFLILLFLGACSFLPDAVSNIPASSFWQGFPLRLWLQEKDDKILAMGGCLNEACSARVVVTKLQLGPDSLRDLQAFMVPEAGKRFFTAFSNHASSKARQRKIVVHQTMLEAGAYRGAKISLSMMDVRKTVDIIILVEPLSGHAVLAVGENAPDLERLARTMISSEPRFLSED
jgi:hypothetical protein